MQLQTEGGLYYFDISVRAEFQGSEYDISVDDGIVGIEGVPSAVKVLNKNAFEEGDDREETVDFAERVENSLSEKSLVTARGINSRLLDVFDNVRYISVIGHGDPEMERDILKGTQRSPVLAFDGSGTAGSDTIALNDMYGVANATFNTYGVAVGDQLQFFRAAPTPAIEDYTITEVNDYSVKVEPDLLDNITTFNGFSVIATTTEAALTLSDIPGGIVDPITPYGEVEVANDEVHIGGVLDVFVRAGFPQQRSTTLEAIRDAEPLHFGLDLESFGTDPDRFVNLTEILSSAVIVENPGDDEFLVKLYNGADLNWWPSDDDIDRYIQLIDPGTNSYTFKITEVLGRELSGPDDVIRIKVSLYDYERLTTASPGAATYSMRIRETVPVASLVRDRDNSRSPAGIDFGAEGAQIGDSIIIEVGDDADIYTIRRILTSIGTGDTLVLSQALSQTVTPAGTGNHSGLRYRVADELDVNLIQPRTTKIPLGNIFLGGDLTSIASSQTVSVSGTTNFVLAGVEEGDTLEITDGDNEGTYSVEGVSATQLTVSPAMQSTSFNQTFEVYKAFDPVERPLVRVREIELLDSSLQSTGINVPYGDVIDARVLGAFSNRAEGTTVESYSAGINSGTYTLTETDPDIDFVALGVQQGYRLTIFNTTSSGEYIVKTVGTSTLVVYNASEGGADFLANASEVHYSVGVASAGFVRLFFQEPTSIEIDTGRAGGRLSFPQTGAADKEFMFSEVDGYYILPSAGSDDDRPRDLRVVRYYDTGGSIFETVVEITDPDISDVYELELEVGDVLEAHEWIPWRVDGGALYDIIAGPPGLKTVAGSDLVTLPLISAVDFEEMPLVGQKLFIDSGHDEGEYSVVEVVDAITLKLNRAMIATTETVDAQELTSPPNATLTYSVGNPVVLEDTDNAPGGAGAAVGDFITIYEVSDWNYKDIIGTYEIEELVSGNPQQIKLKDHPTTQSVPANKFRWFRTPSDTNIWAPFSLYKTIPKELEVKAVATKEVRPGGDVTGSANVTYGGPDIIRLTNYPGLSGNNEFTGAQIGDLVEITYGANGVNEGVYEISDVLSLGGFTDNAIEIRPEKPFGAPLTAVSYRIWGGIHGSRRMLTVGAYEGNDGKLDYGLSIPYAIRRAGVFRTPSTIMEDNFDGLFYYTDIQVESLGSGDDKNLDEDDRLSMDSGYRVDGYTYEVDNNVLTFSPYEEVSLKFDRRFLPPGNSDLPENHTEISGRNLSVGYDLSTTARVINDLMRSDNDRPINANPIARHVLPRYVYMSVTYRGGSSSDVVGKDVEDYINALGQNELEISDVEAMVTRRGAHSVQHPLAVAAITHDLDRALIVDRSDDKLGSSTEEVPYEGSARISSFFAKLNDGLFVVRES
jgi:hypothetical protein